jgi:hypothetical protein
MCVKLAKAEHMPINTRSDECSSRWQLIASKCRAAGEGSRGMGPPQPADTSPAPYSISIRKQGCSREDSCVSL